MKHLLAAAFAVLTVVCSAQDYFQQDVAYTIHVALDDVNHTLSGQLELTYTNNAPEALDHLEMHLWPNAYRNGKTALAKQFYKSGDLFMFYALSKELGYIDSLDFHVNGSPATWQYHPEHIDIAHVQLSTPLAPGQTLTLTTPFVVKLPTAEISRLGHIDQSYLITQWYPKPAVYDREGWHAMPYLNMGEFFSEYGSFDVHITLPKNYVVGATGDLVDCPEEEAFLNELAEKTAAITEFPKTMEFPPSDTETKTLHYHQENVHDFAWFADKRYNVLKGEVELPHSGRKVTTWAMFTNRGGDLWKNSIEYLNDGTYHYSLWNGDYPYNHVTAVDGTISAGAGMEYPNITVVAAMGNAMSLETVIVHEVGHNWFYGILGSNERINAWMDEGINSYNETRYFRTKYGDKLSLASGSVSDNMIQQFGLDDFSYRSRDELAYLLTARNYKDQPMQCHSNDFTQMNYGTVVYKKSAVAMDYLAGYLGQDTFDRAMQAYFDEWKFRHPAPADLQATLERETGKDLDWWFTDLVQTDGKPDYAIRKVKSTADATTVRVSNRGDIPGPIQLSGWRNDAVEAGYWFEGCTPGTDTTITLDQSDFDRISIDGYEQMLEFNRSDNQSDTRGLFKRMEPIKFQLGTYVDDPRHTQLFWLPAVAWNEQDKFMAGLVLHNAALPARPFQWYVTPLYSFSTKSLNGLGGFSWVNGRSLWEANVRRFSDLYAENTDFFALAQDNYVRSALKYTLRPPVAPNARWKTRTGIEVVHLAERLMRETVTEDGQPASTKLWNNTVAPRVFFSFEQANVRLKQGYRFEVRNAIDLDSESSDLALMASFTHKGSFQYNAKGRDIHWGVFAGAVSDGGKSYLPVTGFGRSGRTDPLRDGLFLQRLGTNELLARQTSNNQGNFGYNVFGDNYLVTAHAEWEIPVRLPISLFAAGYGFDTNDSKFETDVIAGISFPIARDVLEIHVPLWGDELFNDSYDIAETITFELHLDRLNVFNMIRNL